MKKMITAGFSGILIMSLASCAPGPVRFNNFLFDTKPAQVTTSSNKNVNIILDQRSQAAANQALQTALQTRQNTSWKTSTASGTITLKRRYKLGIRLCQPFVSSVTMNNQTQVSKATSCQGRHGNWVM